MHQAPHEQFLNYDFKILLPLLSCVRSFIIKSESTAEEGTREQESILTNCVGQISKVIEVYEKSEHL
jgi:hypothetical protein